MFDIIRFRTRQRSREYRRRAFTRVVKLCKMLNAARRTVIQQCRRPDGDGSSTAGAKLVDWDQAAEERGSMLTNVRNNLQLWDNEYDWTADGDEWKHQAERSGVSYGEWKASLVSHLIEPYAGNADVLEIAPGHGRWSEFLIAMSRYTILVGTKCLASPSVVTSTIF